jgi:hypothetical protein
MDPREGDIFEFWSGALFPAIKADFDNAVSIATRRAMQLGELQINLIGVSINGAWHRISLPE